MNIFSAIGAIATGSADAVVFHCNDGGLVQATAGENGTVLVETDAVVSGWNTNACGLCAAEIKASEATAIVQSLGATGVDKVINDW